MQEIGWTFIIGIGLAYIANRIAMRYLKRKSDRAWQKEVQNILMGRPYWPSVKK